MQAIAFVRLFLAIWPSSHWPYSLAKHFGDGFAAGGDGFPAGGLAITIFPGRDRS
jgi:hypothetical protein